MLTRYARRLLANETRGLVASLRSQISPLRLAIQFNFDQWPDLRTLEHDPFKTRALKQALYHFLQNQPNSKDPSRRLVATTIKDYYRVLVVTLDLPGSHGDGAWHRLEVVTSSAIFRILDDDPPEFDDDVFKLADYMAAATRERESLDDAPDPDEDEVLLAGMTMAQRMARQDYARSTAVLRLHTTAFDTRSIPTRTLAMGYAALVGRYAVTDMPYPALASLTLYHLCLITGRDVAELLDIRIGAKPAERCDHPVFDPARWALFITPSLYPELPKALRAVPDKSTEPEQFKAWQRAMQQHQRLYRSVTRVQEVILDDAARWMLSRLADQRAHMKGDDHLFVDERSGKPFTREQARERVPRAVTEAIRQVMPDAPAVTFAALRHTFWTRVVGESNVHPLHAQMQAGRTRSELYSHSFYGCVSEQTLRDALAPPLKQWMQTIQAAYADGITSWATRWGNAPNPLALPTIESRPASSDDHYGSTYCVKTSILRKLVLASLQSLANIPALHVDDAACERAWHDGLTYLCVTLTGACLGSRVGEVAEILVTAVDLGYMPPLVTLIGKGNRFNEEARTLMIPARLVPLWPAVTKSQPSECALNLYGQRDFLRPLRREDVWRHVIAMSAVAGLTGDMADGVIRFHGLRHHLVSWHIARGVPFAHDAYWIGHQTAGAELLHPAGNGSLKAMWAEIEPNLNALLDVLGITDDVIAALCQHDVEKLTLALQAIEKEDDDGDQSNSNTDNQTETALTAESAGA